MPPRSRSRNPASPSKTPVTPPRRSRSSRRSDLSGLDLEPEADDDEYEDTPRKRQRVIEDDDDDDEKDNAVDDEEDKDDNEEEVEDEEDEEEEGEENQEEGTEEVVKVKKEGPKKRGRKKTKLTVSDDGGIYDEQGNLLKIENDEVVLENEDPKGLEKIDAEGNLLGDRKFRIKTFTVLGNGERKYMVSTIPARLVGFRDSYLLFKTHQNLFKKVCTQEEKMDLIERQLIPTSYKGRGVNLVTARSIYREFGAVVLENGKKVVDDFWEQKARDDGEVEGEYADPNDLYKYNITRNNNGDLPIAQNFGNQPTNISGAATHNYSTDPTWQYQLAVQAREFNNRLSQDRGITFGGVRDVYTGLNFLPIGTQPTKHKVFKYESEKESKSIIIDTVFDNKDIRNKVTGLSSLPKLFIDNIEDEEIKKAVLEQVKYEESF